MTSIELVLAATTDRADFKRSFGQANHFLVTIVVGLDSIRHHGRPAEAITLPVGWDPKDTVRSAQRSEAFAIQGALVFLVTALDRYLSSAAALARSTSATLGRELDAAAKEDKGLRGKTLVLADYAEALNSVELALVETALTWRNRLIHPRTSARLEKSLRERLIAYGTELSADYRHLDPEIMIDRFKGDESAPSLKEITAMIKASHRLIGSIDAAILASLDYDAYLRKLLSRHLNLPDPAESANRANRIWGRTAHRARGAIVMIARQSGFTDATPHSTTGVTKATLSELAAMSTREALVALRSQ